MAAIPLMMLLCLRHNIHIAEFNTPARRYHLSNAQPHRNIFYLFIFSLCRWEARLSYCYFFLPSSSDSKGMPHESLCQRWASQCVSQRSPRTIAHITAPYRLGTCKLQHAQACNSLCLYLKYTQMFMHACMHCTYLHTHTQTHACTVHTHRYHYPHGDIKN